MVHVRGPLGPNPLGFREIIPRTSIMKTSVTNSIQVKVDAIEQSLRSYQQAGKRLIVTSSFQTHSLPMLHILQRLQPGIPVVFLDTGYHFEETITFKNEVAELLGLNVGTISGNEKPKACLLYTSPSPRDATLSRMPSSA